MNVLSIADLTATDIESIWSLADSNKSHHTPSGTVAWSFEGNGIRTRTTFIQAFRDLGLPFTELPQLLKTAERVEDLAGYLDPFFSIYVIRESNHERMVDFAAASQKPVINAMSGREHPCEVLTDAYWIDRHIKPLSQCTVCLWGPPTNVFRSWHQLALKCGVILIQVCDPRHHSDVPSVRFTAQPVGAVDVVVTDSWPPDTSTNADTTPIALTTEHLLQMGKPALLPTPPFSIGKELTLDPTKYSGFVGHSQKQWLLPVQKAIIRTALANHF